MPKQQLRLGGAVAIGLASMIGAGVFVVFASAYQIAANYVFLAIGIAAVVAALNAWAIFQLASQVDRPGGVYAYSMFYLNRDISFLSGFAFVLGKISSIAAIALVFQNYVFPQQSGWPAVLAIVALAAINILGINRTASVAAVLSFTSVTFFIALITVAVSKPGNLLDETLTQTNSNPVVSVATAAGVVFFAFAGYARIATLGNEVQDSKRNIPKAIVISLSIVLALYLSLSWVLLDNLGKNLLYTETPVAELMVSLTGNVWITPLVAAAAGLGSMLSILAGVSRTAATMAEDGELPKVFAKRNRFGSPWLAEIVIAISATALTFVGKIVWVIGFSSFSVLFYYAVGHMSAMAQPANERVMPKWLNVVGVVLCVLLAASFGPETVAISAGFLAFTFFIRWLWRRGKAL